ncbi:MAG: hypothetical protein H8E44_41270 [Planctomycetes bacterium]|nr:hypothetical protein [Planctomycetota bacterium]
MDDEVAYTPKAPGAHWKNPGPPPEATFDNSFWEFHRKTEDRLRRKVSKKHPDMSYEETELIVAMLILEMFENNPEKFFAHLPAASAEDRKLIESADAKMIAGDMKPKNLAFMVQWKV